MFYIENFKNFKEAHIDLSKPFTILIGPNGSGKSNLIEAMELLSHIIKGYSLGEITDVGRWGRLEIRGGLESCVRFNEKDCSLGVLSEERDEPYKTTINFENPPVFDSKNDSDDLKKIGKYFNFLIQVFDLYPKKMRTYQRIRNTNIVKDGSNLCCFIFATSGK